MKKKKEAPMVPVTEVKSRVLPAGLPIILVTPAPGGGLLTRQLPRQQSGLMRYANPPPEYVWLAAESANTTLTHLGLKLNDAGVTLRFVEPVDNPEGPVLGFAGFFSGDSPDSVWIVVPSAPAEDLPWYVAHEIGHADYYHRNGHDGSKGPTDRGPSEVFADALADELFTRSPASRLAHELALPFLADLSIEGLLLTGPQAAITVTNAGATVVIDGTSNMFKICASGTISLGGPNGSPAQTSTYVDVTTNLAISPAFVAYIEANGSSTGQIYTTANITLDGVGHVVQHKFANASYQSSTQTRVSFTWQGIGNFSAVTNYLRYYLYKEAGF